MILLLICIIIVIIFTILATFDLKIEIENLKVSLPNKKKEIINKDNKIFLEMYILKKLRIGKVNFNKVNLSNEKSKLRMNRLLEINNLDIILKNFSIDIEKLNLDILIGTEDAAITAIVVGIVSSIIGIVLRNKIKNIKFQKYEVMPIYSNNNFLKLELNGIFTFNIVNIIDMIKLFRKRSVEENDRTSDRRTYVYSNE